MKLFPGGSLLQIAQGVATPVAPQSGSAANSAGSASTQFVDQIRGAAQVQHTGQSGRSAAASQTVETIQIDRPQTGSPPRDLPRGSIVNILV